MSHAIISNRPVSVTRMTHYYQGRPNIVFLDKYHTLSNHPSVRRT